MQRIVQDCLSAVAEGDVESLEECMIEADREASAHELGIGSRARGVAREAEAEVVLEDCMQAIADGDLDELTACLLEITSAADAEAANEG